MTRYTDYDSWKLAYPDEWDVETEDKEIDLSEMSLEEIIEAIDYDDFDSQLKQEAIDYLLQRYDFDYYSPNSYK